MEFCASHVYLGGLLLWQSNISCSHCCGPCHCCHHCHHSYHELEGCVFCCFVEWCCPLIVCLFFKGGHKFEWLVGNVTSWGQVKVVVWCWVCSWSGYCRCWKPLSTASFVVMYIACLDVMWPGIGVLTLPNCWFVVTVLLFDTLRCKMSSWVGFEVQWCWRLLLVGKTGAGVGWVAPWLMRLVWGCCSWEVEKLDLCHF